VKYKGYGATVRLNVEMNLPTLPHSNEPRRLKWNMGCEKNWPGTNPPNLWYFRQFYVVFADRSPEINRKPCGVLADISLEIEKSMV
jgi:hypothetical protein